MLCTLRRGGVRQINKGSPTEKHTALCADCAQCVMYELNGEKGETRSQDFGNPDDIKKRALISLIDTC